MKHAIWVVAMLLCGTVAYGEGGPVEKSPETGLLQFAHSHYALLRGKRVTITLPRFHPESEYAYATVRAEYVLELNARDHKRPLTVTVAWPTEGAGNAFAGGGTDTGFYIRRPAIKFDGRPVPYRWLDYRALEEPYLTPVVQRIDAQLAARPALQAEVRGLRDEARKDESWEARARTLGDWMAGNGFATGNHRDEITLGLLAPQEYDYFGQTALQWLDPSFHPFEINDRVMQQWGFESLILDPKDGQLVFGDWGGPEGDYAVFLFTVTLRPGRRHRLVVDYQQSAYSHGSDPPIGLIHLLRPAAFWGGERESATYEIRVHKSYGRPTIRPPARQGRSAGEYRVYRFQMDHPPEENLFVSFPE